MSSYENRFRLFSSVEYEGQFYMTPLNFIECVTLNEPKSECTAFTLLNPTRLNERICTDEGPSVILVLPVVVKLLIDRSKIEHKHLRDEDFLTFSLLSSINRNIVNISIWK